MHESVTVFLTRVGREFQKLRSGPYEWFVLVGNRLLLASLLTFVFALGVLIFTTGGFLAVGNTTRMLYLFQVLVGGNLTLLTIVLSINQLVLSREFNTPGELHDQIRNVMAYRNDVEETMNRDEVPVTPADFLFVLLEGTRDNARRLEGLIEGVDRGQFAERADAIIDELTSQTDRNVAVLDREQDGLFHALTVTLEADYSRQLNEAHRLRTTFEDDLPSEASEAFDDLIANMKQVDIARQYFKSIYMQSELARLSRILLYVGFPAVGSALLMLLVYAGAPQTPVAVDHLDVIVPAVVILGISPLAVLFAFVLRIAMVAERTVAITPFTRPT